MRHALVVGDASEPFSHGEYRMREIEIYYKREFRWLHLNTKVRSLRSN